MSRTEFLDLQDAIIREILRGNTTYTEITEALSRVSVKRIRYHLQALLKSGRIGRKRNLLDLRMYNYYVPDEFPRVHTVATTRPITQNLFWRYNNHD